jgi:molecular chaperone GrpE (heat shock protein)
VPLNDRVFLFFVFVNLCGKQELQDGWYFCERASTMMKNIRRWMTKEDKMEAENEKAKQKTIKHFLDLADTLEEMVASEPADGSDGAAESDGMESD